MDKQESMGTSIIFLYYTKTTCCPTHRLAHYFCVAGNQRSIQCVQMTIIHSKITPDNKQNFRCSSSKYLNACSDYLSLLHYKPFIQYCKLVLRKILFPFHSRVSHIRHAKTLHLLLSLSVNHRSFMKV